MSSINSPDWVYDKQRAVEQVDLNNVSMPACFSSPDSIDAWRHSRMWGPVTPLLQEYKDGSFLTVGDGNFGSDAYYLSNFSNNVLASSLDTQKLQLAKNKGLISQFVEENAEAIQQEDNSFDLVFCKEAYHHFPRPPIAFYEMLRVSKEALVLIEPNESGVKLLDYLKQKLKRIIRRDKAYASTEFEPAGNYIYRTNPRDIEKYLIAMNFRYFAYKQMNDFYHPSISHKNKGNKFGYMTTIFFIKLQDVFCKLKLMNYGLVCLVAFKTSSPSEKLLVSLKQSGFVVSELPVNPYQ